jgi:hypothetical protein
LVLDGVDGLSSLARSLFMVAELLEVRDDTAVANGVLWGLICVGCCLVAFPKAKNRAGAARSERNANLAEDEADALWTWVSAALDSLASNALLTVWGSSSSGSLCS